MAVGGGSSGLLFPNLLISLFVLFCIYARAEAAAEPSPSMDNLLDYSAKTNLSHSEGLSSPYSWNTCVFHAEQARSERDLKFFVSASNLSNAKQWFVSHSIKNESQFCSDISICEQTFDKSYSEADGTYPLC